MINRKTLFTRFQVYIKQSTTIYPYRSSLPNACSSDGCVSGVLMWIPGLVGPVIFQELFWLLPPKFFSIRLSSFRVFFLAHRYWAIFWMLPPPLTSPFGFLGPSADLILFEKLGSTQTRILALTRSVTGVSFSPSLNVSRFLFLSFHADMCPTPPWPIRAPSLSRQLFGFGGTTSLGGSFRVASCTAQAIASTISS